MSNTKKIKVASASMNQTVVNFTRNVPNILKAIDAAIADGADILSLQELGLTGYSGDDYFKWIRTDSQQQEIVELVDYIGKYAAERDPNLVISMGLPLFYADKDQPVKINIGSEEKPAMVDNPLYNINNRPFNGQALISGGKIQSISAKSIQPDGAAEYEPRQFTSWPDYMGVKEIELYNGQKIPFGNVVAQLGEGKDAISLYQEICAEGWRGIYDDGTINQKELEEGRQLNDIVKKNDISLTLNPSASKPEPFLDKPELRATLCKTGSDITKGAYVYTNTGGVEAAPAAFEFGSIFANNGDITHRGERYSLADVVYSSQVMEVPVPEKSNPDVAITHEFSEHSPGLVQGGSADWESHDGRDRVMEEITRSTTLWLRDYLKKTGQQGYFISLSGGQDSAFGAVMISQMIDLNIQQLEDALGDKGRAVDAFIEQFDGLEYTDDVKRANSEKGAEAAIDVIKSQMLTCGYLPSENSSKATEDAARFLVEGGTTADVIDAANGEAKTLFVDPEKDRIEGGVLYKWLSDDNTESYKVQATHENQKGIGGTFHIVDVQNVIDSYMEAFSGVDDAGLGAELKDKIHNELKEFIKGDREALSEDVQTHVKRRVPSWNNDRDDILLQNIQARARSPMAWLFGNDEHKIACVTSNWSEAVAGYWTFGGDGHMGSINIAGGVPKSDLRDVLDYLQTNGLHDLPEVQGLAVVNGNKASAELRPLKDGEIAQFDEDDMMPYEQLDTIARTIIIGKNSPVEAYQMLKDTDQTFKDGTPLFRSDEELISCIEECCWRWHANQFKRVAAVITPFLGENVDPHTAVRTTIIGDGFQTGRAMLKLEYLKDQIGGEEAFETHVGTEFNEMRIRAKIDRGLRDTLLNTNVSELREKITDPDFAASVAVDPWMRGAA